MALGYHHKKVENIRLVDGVPNRRLNLPENLFYLYLDDLDIPALIDTGASISIIPKKFVNKWDTTGQIRLQGLVSHTYALGSIELTVPVNIPYNPPTKFYVVDLQQDFAILGINFLSQRELLVDTSIPSLIQQNNGTSYYTSLRRGGDPLGSSEGKELLGGEPPNNLALIPQKIDMVLDTKDKEIEWSLVAQECEKLLGDFPQLVTPGNYLEPPKHDLVLDVEPIDKKQSVSKFRAYKKPLNGLERKLVREKLMDMEKRGIIRRTAALAYSSPITLTTKKNGDIRICVNYRCFNALTKQLHYPLPNPNSIAEELRAEHVIFSNIDLRDAYFSLPLSKRTSDLCGIMVDGIGAFVPLRTMFGMKQAPAVFQQLAEQVIAGMESFIFCYLDDFLIFSSSVQEHLQHLRMLFQRLDKYGLKVNRDKCRLGVPELQFLGYNISSKGISPLQDAAKALEQREPPNDIRGLRSFLGSISYYRRFLPNLAEIVEPLNKKLQGKNVKSRARITLTKEELAARETAIQLLASATRLQYENPELPMVLTTDASKSHAGAVLEQSLNSGDFSVMVPLAFYSARLPRSTKVRSVFNAELTAMYKAIVHFRVRLRNRPLILRTDHSALKNALENVTGLHSPRELSMLNYIKEYSPVVHYLEGSHNFVADWLSRPNSKREIENGKLEAKTDSETDVEDILNIQRVMCNSEEHISPMLFDSKKEKIAKEIKKSSLEEDMEVCEKICDGVSLWGVFERKDAKNFRIWVPKSIRPLIWSKLHNILHQGGNPTLETIGKSYFWPNMEKDVIEWCRNCVICQQTKTSRYQRTALSNYPGGEERLSVVHLDTVGPLPDSNGNSYILTIKDRATGFLWASALPNKTALTVCDKFVTTFIAVCGLPSKIISDRGTEFSNNIFLSMLKKNGIKHSKTCAYNPKCNGLVERCHRDLKRAINALKDRSTWSYYLPYFTLQINNLCSDSNHFTAYQRLFGRPASIPGEILFPPQELPELISDADTEAFQTLQQFHKKVSRPLKGPQKYIDKNLMGCDFVFVKNEQTTGKDKKPWKGPFRVLSRGKKFFLIDFIKNQRNVTIDRLKVSYPLKQKSSSTSESSDSECIPDNRKNRVNARLFAKAVLADEKLCRLTSTSDESSNSSAEVESNCSCDSDLSDGLESERSSEECSHVSDSSNGFKSDSSYDSDMSVEWERLQPWKYL